MEGWCDRCIGWVDIDQLEEPAWDYVFSHPLFDLQDPRYGSLRRCSRCFAGIRMVKQMDRYMEPNQSDPLFEVGDEIAFLRFGLRPPYEINAREIRRGIVVARYWQYKWWVYVIDGSQVHWSTRPHVPESHIWLEPLPMISLGDLFEAS